MPRYAFRLSSRLSESFHRACGFIDGGDYSPPFLRWYRLIPLFLRDACPFRLFEPFAFAIFLPHSVSCIAALMPMPPLYVRVKDISPLIIFDMPSAHTLRFLCPYSSSIFTSPE